MSEKKYLDEVGLGQYDLLIKEHIDSNFEEAKSYADKNDESIIADAKAYTDGAVANKSQVQFILWGADD